MNTEILAIFASITSILLLIGFFWLLLAYRKLNQIRKEFFGGNLEKNLEQVLVDQNRSITTMNKEINRLNDDLSNLTMLNKQDIKKIGFIRFNPFDDAGGNMSFSLALLNEHDDGIVLSSLHSREGTRIYAKSIKKGVPEHKLTEEEEEAIEKAK